ncbi:hypothetical protein SLE2022_172260 [Rubroshorea leprosula]
MGLTGKLEADVEMKCSAERFHEVFCSRPHHISKVTTDNIQGVELHEGEWGAEGSVICWSYVHDGDAKSQTHWTLEYEKLNEDVAHPETLMEFCAQVSKEIDCHLTRTQA